MKVLGIETSCDECSAAVVRDGSQILSNVIATQIELHRPFDGVVPEIASRKHIEKINQVIDQALEQAECTLDDIDAIAVTYGPGLVGALLVGVSAAKSIAFAKDIPLVGVHHIEGHISANYIENIELEPPFMCLVVSGGHSHLVKVADYGKYEILGRTRDDAAGEAFDKVAKLEGKQITASMVAYGDHTYSVIIQTKPVVMSGTLVELSRNSIPDQNNSDYKIATITVDGVTADFVIDSNTEELSSLSLGFTVILTIGIPTLIGIRINHPVIGILIGGVLAIAYIIFYAVKRK